MSELWMVPDDEDGPELVSESMACPKCGERRVDWLFIDDDEGVEMGQCDTCGYCYEVA